MHFGEAHMMGGDGFNQIAGRVFVCLVFLKGYADRVLLEDRLLGSQALSEQFQKGCVQLPLGFQTRRIGGQEGEYFTVIRHMGPPSNKPQPVRSIR